ncbi:DNA-binding Xre family transcriptional regulator [Acholeplasma morum]|uniref:hypothetical protein n=1 Tax=Paracholeplasma morum TaxID=264637 RepID=UPI001957553D|nr:hypothetical protein [Paracholeplasma morum]MBM7454143.1 DNA-binding Xre family transcriptional regulator [Paracholeplasma morum]
MSRLEYWSSITLDDIKTIDMNEYTTQVVKNNNHYDLLYVFNVFSKLNKHSDLYKRIIFHFVVGNMILNGRSTVTLDKLQAEMSRLSELDLFNYPEHLYIEIKRRIDSRMYFMRNSLTTAEKNGFNNLLPLYREVNHFTSAYVAQKIRLTEEQYMRIEKNPLLMTVKDLFHLCDLYEVSPNDLLSFKAQYQLIMKEVFEDKK